MKISLLTKFFLAFLITGAVLVGVLISLIQFYGSRNFSDYVAQKESRQLDTLVEVLQEAYTREGNWDFLNQNHREWQQVLRMAGLIPQDAPPMPPPKRPAFGRDAWGRPAQDNTTPPFPRHWDRPNDLGPRISLLDRDHTLVMGRPLAGNGVLRPLMVGGTETGYLGFNRPPNLSHPLDLEYLKQQKKIFFMAGGLFLACSVLVSVGLAFHLLSPIRKLSRATRALGKRQFDTRITLKTRDELGQLARDFNRMALTLEDYEKRQVQWLSDISHELRTPLAILKGELEAVQDGIRPLKPETVDALYHEVDHLIRLVSDLHDLSMAEARMMVLTFRELDLSSLLIHVLDRFRNRLDDRGFTVETEIDPSAWLTGDGDRLTQLFSNLLDNVLAYTAPKGRLCIACKADKNTVSVNIENSGPGVEAHLLPRLFDRLFRADAARNRKQGGSGLGLAICRQIVLAHQGRIQALESTLGGINMDICLPRHPETKGDRG